MDDYEQLSNIPLAQVRAENREVNQRIEELEATAERVEDLEAKAEKAEDLEQTVEDLKADIETRDQMLQQFASEKRQQALTRFEQANERLPEAQRYDLADLGINAEAAAQGGDDAPSIEELERVASMVEQQAEAFEAQRQQVSNAGQSPDLSSVGADQQGAGAGAGTTPTQNTNPGAQPTGTGGGQDDLAERAQRVANDANIGGAWSKLQNGEKLAERATFEFGSGTDSGIDEDALASALSEAQQQTDATTPNGGQTYPPQSGTGGSNGGGV